MTKDNPGYVYAYGWNRVNTGLIGIWPESHQNFFMKNRALLWALFVFVLIWLPMTASLYFLRDNLSELVGCLVINVPVSMAVYKLVLFRLRRRALLIYLTAMANDWLLIRTEEEKKVMLEKAKYSRFISIMSVSLVVWMFISFSSVGVWAARVQRAFISNETQLGVGFLYYAYFPYDTKEFRPFVLTWLGQWYSTLFSMIGYAGPDSLMAMIILHLCGQLATVRIALKNIVDEKCLQDPYIYWKRLSSIIQRHEELNRRAELIEESFNEMLLIQMLQCTIAFCFQGFVTLTTIIDGFTSDKDFPFLQVTFFVILVIYMILHLFVYCWAGDLLVAESTALSHAPYESDWFLLEPAQVKALMMVTHRSRIPLQITAGKFIGFSLKLFTRIMKTSMGYLSVLLAMKED